MNKILKLDEIKHEEDDEETFPIEMMDGDEAREILGIMDYQNEMFLGGLNDELIFTTLGLYNETREQFETILKEWNKLYTMVKNKIK